MKTFKTFIIECSEIAERYIEPNENLSSGRGNPTDIAKKRAEVSSEKYPEERRKKQSERLPKVKRGADNKEVDTTEHPDYDISSGSSGNSHYFYHKPTGVEYSVQKFTKTKKGTPVHTLSWDHSQNTSKMSTKDKTSLFRNAMKVGKDLQHRLPQGSVVEAQPDPDKKGNRRAKVYSKLGLGEPTPRERGMRQSQFSKVGRNPSPRQAAKGKTRLKPVRPSEVDEN
jgi:hypothetical protein